MILKPCLYSMALFFYGYKFNIHNAAHCNLFSYEIQYTCYRKLVKEFIHQHQCNAAI